MKINYWQPFIENGYYHIYNHSVSSKNIFLSHEDYIDFLKKYCTYFSGLFETLAFCLMPNHFHFVVKVNSHHTVLEKAKKQISNASHSFQENKCDLNTFIVDQFRRFFSSFSLSYNYRHKRRGQLFLKRFKRISLDEEFRLAYMICYIHHNPIHHGFSTSYDSWKYSSYNQILAESEIIKKSISTFSFEELDILSVAEVIPCFDGIDGFINSHRNFLIDKEQEINLDY
jgi:REP element-mobilizing transposase RayT